MTEKKNKESTMKQKNLLLYAVIGALIGGVLVWIFTNVLHINQTSGRIMQVQSARKTADSGMMSDVNKHFIEQMIPHHQNAIDMAEIALAKSKHEELKRLSSNIKQTQSLEIDQMKKWYKKWFETEVPETPPGQIHGMMEDGTDLNALANTQYAEDFEREFLSQMITHHQMALMMSNMLLADSEKPEMKQLAQSIIDTQAQEIKNMKKWYKEWGY